MDNLFVEFDSLADTLQYINLIKVKFKAHDNWFIMPVLYASEGMIEVIINSENIIGAFNKDNELIFKFQRQGYEYIVEGLVSEVIISKPCTMEIKIKKAQKYYNLRKDIRFETELNVSFDLDINKSMEEMLTSNLVGVVKNLSNGGVMVYSDVDIPVGSEVNLLLNHKSTNLIQCTGKIIRATKDKRGKFFYGIQFIKINQENQIILEKKVEQLENEYLQSLTSLREYIEKDSMKYKTKIVLFSTESDKSIEIRETLTKKGAENFTLFTEFIFYAEFFEIEKPKIVIVDCSNLDNTVFNFVKKIKENLQDVTVLLVMPMEFAQDDQIVKIANDKTIPMFKPLIYNEFDEEIIKHL